VYDAGLATMRYTDAMDTNLQAAILTPDEELNCEKAVKSDSPSGV
jgi:hypothetical protein